jgi:hypothetical protein
MNDIAKIRRIIMVVGILAALFEGVFPPLRSPEPYYAQGILVNQQLVAVHISRFSSWGDFEKFEDGSMLRTEVDGGELLRELAFLAAIFGAAYLWPHLLPGTHSESDQNK